MEDFILIITILLKSDKGFGPEKKESNICINPMQMDLVQYKVLHMTFELTRI